MRPFWTPLSALLVPDPPALATPGVLRLMLRAGKPVELLYAGDRMWPFVRHGQRVMVDPLPQDTTLAPGSAVVCCPSGIPDLLRIESHRADAVRLAGDSDPIEALEAHAGEILALARVPPRRTGARTALARRLVLDVREALTGRPDSRQDPASTVRSKYDSQAPFYAAGGGVDMTEAMLAWVRGRIAPGGKVLVAGSGTGRESFALAREGFEVTGVDFSRVMVDAALREAERRKLDVSFHLADLRTHEEPPGSLSGIYFTFDVYSFLPEASERVSLLRRMGRWLAPGGVVLLSARRFERTYDRFILTLQRASRIGERQARWGHSHTRWIATDGSLRRSFVQVFTGRALRREVEGAGFLMGEWRGNHCTLTPREAERAATNFPEKCADTRASPPSGSETTRTSQGESRRLGSSTAQGRSVMPPAVHAVPGLEST